MNIGDYGYKRHRCHLKEHLEQFLLPHSTAFKNKYKIDIEHFIQDVILIYEVFSDSISATSNLSKKEIKDKSFQKLLNKIDNNQDIQALSNILKKISVNVYNHFKEEQSLKALLLIFTMTIKANINNIKCLNNEALKDDIIYDIKSFLNVYNQDQKENNEYIDNQNKNYKAWKPFVRLSTGVCLIDSLFVIGYLDRFIIHCIYQNQKDIDTYNTIHAKAFEKHVADFFKKLLPYDAKLYSSYFYRDKRNGKMESVEIDLLIIINDICFICEIKSGRMVYGSNSITFTYKKPQEIQLKQLLDKINTGFDVEFKNKDKDRFILCKNKYQKIIPILITQDTLQVYSVAEKQEHSIAYSIDDLRIFRDVLNPIYIIDFFDKHLFFNKTLSKKKVLGDNIDIFERYIRGNLIDFIEDINNKEGNLFSVESGNNNKFINDYLFKKDYTDNINIELLTPIMLTKELDELLTNILKSDPPHKYSTFINLMYIIFQYKDKVADFYCKALTESKFLSSVVTHKYGLFVINSNKVIPLSNNEVKKQVYNNAVNKGIDKDNCTLITLYVNNGSIESVVIDYYVA